MTTEITNLFIIASIILSIYFIVNRRNRSKSLNLPPGPPKLPIIGNIHQLPSRNFPHRSFHTLALKYGPIMHLQLGQVSTIVISSPRLAKEVMKTNDLAFASRPYSLFGDIVFYGNSDVALGPYGDYWRQMKKIITAEVLSAKKVRSFSGLRKQEVDNFIDFVRSKCGKPMIMRKKVTKLFNSIICKSSFGDDCKQQDMLTESLADLGILSSGLFAADLFPQFGFLSVVTGLKYKLTKMHKIIDKIFDEIFEEHKIKRQQSGESEEHDLLHVLFNIKETGGLQFPITDDNIKGVFMDMFTGGVDTSAVTLEWAMTEMMRNPSVMDKAQKEVREAFKGKKIIEESDLQELVYLKFVIKETLRLHPPLPILLPRECREQCQIDGYDIPVKTKVIVNAFACSLSHDYWDDAESFMPERFDQSTVDFIGTNFEFVPFGSGRRICPGMAFGLITIELALAQMLYYFNWKLPSGSNYKDLDMREKDGLSPAKKVPLSVIPTLYSSI